MSWELFIKWLPDFLEGAWLTLQLVGVSVVAGLFLALPLGTSRVSRTVAVRALSSGALTSLPGPRPTLPRVVCR